QAQAIELSDFGFLPPIFRHDPPRKVLAVFGGRHAFQAQIIQGPLSEKVLWRLVLSHGRKRKTYTGSLVRALLAAHRSATIARIEHVAQAHEDGSAGGWLRQAHVLPTGFL